jgi:antitoxin YefM
MAHVTYTELRANLAGFMDEVCNTRDALLVTRQGARSVVMVSEEDYEGLMETVHLLRSPANAARLLEAIEQVNRGELSEHDLIEPKAAMSVA